MIQYSKSPANVAILSFDNQHSSVNIINGEFITELDRHISVALSDQSVKGIIVTSAKKDFLLGADLKMILGISDPEKIMEITNRLHQVFRKMETGGKPVVAAINGTVLGGGYELCLSCHYRIVINNSVIQIGLPEVTLGLLPGGGGTQRMPRLIGVQEALSLLLEGKKLRPEQALKTGLVNSLVETQEQLIPAATEWILKQEGKVQQPWDKEGFKIPGGGVQSPAIAMLFPAAAGLVLKKTFGNYPAVPAILNCIYEGLQLPIDRALLVECRYFTSCVLSQVAKNMIRTLFINMNAANKGEARPEGVPATNLRKVGILGAGMMGAGIAYVSALNGLEIVLKDTTREAAESGKAYSVRLLSEKILKNQLTKEKYEEVLSRIFTTCDAADLKGCDLVIEAVFENRELKAQVTRETEAVLVADAVFASNTSTLPITGLAKASVRPENFIGLHFFSPVDKMQLVEIILGKKTSAYAIAMAIDYVKRIRKTPIVVNDGRGFYTSRVFSTYLYEGMECLAEGICPALIENAGKMAGMPVGPLALADEVSIELCYKINKQTEADTGKRRTDAAVGVIERMVDEFKRPGKKAGKGFYEYPATGKKFLWKDMERIFPGANNEYSDNQLAINQTDVEELKKRLLYIQSLEAVKCLEENIITKPADADIGSVLGWGFAPFTGGAISFIEGVGLKEFVAESDRLAKKYGKRFRPTKGLKEMAEQGRRFYT